MKKLILLIAVVAMMLSGCKKINEELDALGNRIDRLENKAIPSIDEQVAAIKVSLTLFDTVDKEYVNLINTLEESGVATTEKVATLKSKGAELYQQIANLRSYVDSELSNLTNWADATFATLEQHHILIAKLAELKAVINVDISETAQALNNAIVALEISLQSWVGELILGYYTISEVDAKIMALQNTIANVNGALQDELKELRSQLETTATEITEAYKKAIAEAIETNNGIINTKIEAEVLALNTRISEEIATVNERLAAIEKRLADVEGKVATIEEQIVNINASLENLSAMDTELKGYINGLSATATNLQEQINNTNTKIDEVKKTLEDEIASVSSNMQSDLATAKADVLAQLEALRTEMENELAQINTTIATLQAKDKEIENQIAALNTYVDNELSKTTDWVNATFATLEQYNALVVEIAVIKEQINATNQSIKALETYLTTKINADIATAVSALNADIQQKVKEITDAYTNAIKAANEEITAAYTTAIQTAISNLDTSLKAWVSSALSNYYTIAEIDALLAALEQEMNGKLEAQKAYLEGLINELSVSTAKSIAENKSLIDGLQKDITNLQATSAEHASRIAQNASTIATNTQNIIDISKSIYTNGSNIADNDKAIAENKALIEANAKLIAENAAEIEALKASPDASVVKNAAKIATNAENIANNAALIAANATAISNNAAAIANNAADILQLQQDLAATKAEITEAYKTAINDAITTNNGIIDAKIAAKVDAINTRIDNEVAIINASIKTLTDRMNALEAEMDTLKGMVADFLKEFDEIKETIERILSMIQSVSYVPQYSDGKAVMPVVSGVYDGEVELDFQLSPKSVVSDIVANWQNILSVKAVYTKTRAVTYVDMPILSCVADGQNGIITVVASGRNLGEEFFKGNQAVNAALFISDGNNDKVSDYVEVVPVNTTGDEIIPATEIWYTSVDGKIVAPNIPTAFNAVLLSNTYHSDKGILKFDADVTEIKAEAFKGCANFVSMTLPNTIETIGDNAFSGCSGLHTISLSESLKDMGEYAFYQCSSLRSINIPNGVNVIKTHTFSYCTKLLSTTIPNSVTNIDSYVFYDCTSLTSVNISDLSAWCRIEFTDAQSNPLNNGANMYLNGELVTELTIPSDITEVKNYAFYNCKSLKSVDIHDGITSIGSNALYGEIPLLSINSKIVENGFEDGTSDRRWGGRFTEVVFGENITQIGSYFLKNHTSLSTITIPDNITYIGASAFYGCSGLTRTVIGRGVTSWGDYNIFSGCTGELVVKCNVRDMFEKTSYSSSTSYTTYYGLFSGSRFSKVVIEEGVTYIGSRAFGDSSSITSVTIPNSITSIGSGAFGSYYSDITRVDISDLSAWYNIDFADGSANPLCGGGELYLNQELVTNITIPSEMSEVKNYTFYGCKSLTNLTIPDTVTSIGNSAFCGCSNLTKTIIGKGVTSWGNYNIFSECTGELIVNSEIRGAFAVLTTPTSSYYNYYGLFNNSKFSKVVIGDNVTTVGSRAFSNCSLLTDVTIGKNVTSIGEYAFNSCSNLASVYCNMVSPPIIGTSVFSSSSKLSIYVYDESYNLFLTKWSSYSSNIVSNGAIQDVSSQPLSTITYKTEDNNILDVNFASSFVVKSHTYNGGVGELVIYGSQLKLPSSLFYGCTSLTSLTLPDTITSIESSAFSGCSNLEEVSLPNNITSIEPYAFYNCSALTNVVIPSTVTSIGNYAFYGCGNLVSATIPNGVTSIGHSSFYDCSSLLSVVIPDSVTSIGDSAFYRCSSLTSAILSNSITSIGESVFRYCSSLTSITIPEKVRTIDEYAFDDCDSLTSIYCKPTTPPNIHYYHYYSSGSFPFNSGMKIYVPRASYSSYMSYNNYNNNQVVPANWYKYESYITAYDFE